jgi:hypothetical protein
MIEAVDDVMVHTSGAGTNRNRPSADGSSVVEDTPAVTGRTINLYKIKSGHFPAWL